MTVPAAAVGATPIIIANGTATIATSVANPWVHYAAASDDWATDAGLNVTTFAWHDPETVTGSTAPKSIYDPCPPGWKLPPGGSAQNSVWDDFDRQEGISLVYANSQNPVRDLSWGYGRGIGTATTPVIGLRYWTGATAADPVEGRIWYPATGLRIVGTGALTNVGSSGSYWSAGPSTAAYGFRLNFLSGSVGPSSSNHRACGFAARCLSE
jgi:hypothetical protein